MIQVNLWDIKNSKVSYYNDIQEVLNYMRQNPFNAQRFLVLDDKGLDEGEEKTNLILNYNKKAKEKNIEIKYFDEKHPLFIDNVGSICISKSFYEKHADIIKKTVEDGMFSNDKDFVSVYVNKYMYTDVLVNHLILVANNIGFDQKINLPSEVIKNLNNAHVNAFLSSDAGRIEISTNLVLGQEYDAVISDSDTITIKDDITDYENLSLIPNHKEINIKLSNNEYLQESYDKMYDIIFKLRENGQKNKIVIHISNRNRFLKSKLHNSDFDIVIDGLSFDKYSLKELQKEDELLDLMVEDIKKIDSNYEKFIACYNIVKKFKQYKEDEDSKQTSRKIKGILNSDSMVCVGFAALLKELLSRVGINSYNYSVSVDNSYDNGFTLEERPVSFVDHARLIVKLKDDKYKIDGVFVSDPTWDNNLENDYYNHALMSFDKTSSENSFFKLTVEDLILNVKDMKEFSFKLNLLINKEIKNPFFAKNFTDKQKIDKAYQNVICWIFSILQSLFKEEYFELKNKYSKLNELNIDYDLAHDFFTEAGNLFVRNHIMDVPIDKTIEAASKVNYEIFGFDKEYNSESFSEYKMDLLKRNERRDKLCFPFYYEDAKKYMENHLSDVIDVFNESFKSLPILINKLDESKKQKILNTPYLIDFLNLNPNEAFRYGGCLIFAKILNDVLPDTKFVVEYGDDKKPVHFLLRNEKTYFDINYNEFDENYKYPNDKYHDANLRDLLFAEENFFDIPNELYELLESSFKSNLRMNLSVGMEFEKTKINKHY